MGQGDDLHRRRAAPLTPGQLVNVQVVPTGTPPATTVTWTATYAYGALRSRSSKVR